MAELETHYEREDLGGGRFRHVQNIKPIAFQRDGAMLRITNALGNSGDQQLPVGVDELVQFRVRDRLAGNSPLLHFGKGNSHVRLTPLDTANVNGQVNGNVILFPGARPGADLRLSVGGHRVETEWILGTGHPAQFRWRVDEHGGGFDPVTLAWPEFRMLPPVLVDPATGLHETLSWVVAQQGGRYILAVTLPAGNHAGKILDPTLTLQPGAADGIDTRISSTSATTNFGTAANGLLGEVNSAASIQRMLFKFDLSGLPSAALISSAVLSLYAVADFATNAPTFLIYRQLRAWTELGVTWNKYDGITDWQSAGGFGAADCEQASIGSAVLTATETLNVFKDFTLTPTSKAALDLGNGWLIKSQAELNDAYQFNFSDHASSSTRPTLVIIYTLPAGGIFWPGVTLSAVFGGAIVR